MIFHHPGSCPLSDLRLLPDFSELELSDFQEFTPLGHPGDFPLGLGSLAGVPIAAKSVGNP